MKLSPSQVQGLVYVNGTDGHATVKEFIFDLRAFPDLWEDLFVMGLVTVNEDECISLTELGTNYLGEIPF